MSKLVVENAPVSNDLEIPSQQRELPETVKTFPCTEREAAESLPVARELKTYKGGRKPRAPDKTTKVVKQRRSGLHANHPPNFFSATKTY